MVNLPSISAPETKTIFRVVDMSKPFGQIRYTESKEEAAEIGATFGRCALSELQYSTIEDREAFIAALAPFMPAGVELYIPCGHEDGIYNNEIEIDFGMTAYKAAATLEAVADRLRIGSGIRGVFGSSSMGGDWLNERG